MISLRSVLGGIAAAGLLLAGTAAAADDYPSRPITIIVPYGAGGGVDGNARALAPHLEKILGQNVIVENRTGAGGVKGHTMGAFAKPDGYTLTFVSPGIIAAPWLIEGVTFTPEDYTYIGQVSFVPNMLIVNADSQWKTLDGLVASLKEKPGEISSATTGGWSSKRITLAVFENAAGVESKIVSGYKGGAEWMAAVMGGHIDFAINDANELLPQKDAGALRILAAAAPERSKFFPDVPTFKEQGYDVTVGVWRTLAGPKGLPDAIRDKLSAALKQAMETEALKQDFEKIGLTTDYLSPADTRALVLGQYKELGELFTKLGINLKKD